MYERNNGYVVSEQGKPPDFVLEIASPSTRAEDNTDKREFYARHGVVEYWRFDKEDRPAKSGWPATGWWGGAYEPVAIEELDDCVLQGYSAVLNLHLRWEQGQLAWHDPATGRHIATFESERAARVAEREARARAEAERNAEREAHLAAEARVR